ncbi:GNAT family N-acetyltransferase [Brachybacterium sp. DNPG3]
MTRELSTDGAGTPGMGVGAVRLHRVGPQDWESHRDLRLDMLRADPDAFWARADQLSAWDEADWRRDAAGPRRHIQVRRGGAVLGGIGVLPEGYTPEHPLPADAVHLVSLWVRPAARGTGLSALLLQGATELAMELGRPRLLLDVDARNIPARRLYERSGFRATGAEEAREGTGSRWIEYGADARSIAGA